MPSAADKLLSLTSRASSSGSIHTSWLLSGERAPFGPVEPLRTYLLRARQTRCRLTRIYGRTAPPSMARSRLVPAGRAPSAAPPGFGPPGWFLGRILDRHGARIPLAIAGALGGLVAVGLASLSSGWQIMPLFFARSEERRVGKESR